MHLSSPALSLIRSKKPKVKFTKAKLKAYELDLRAYNKERKRANERQITLDEFIKLRTGKLKAPKDPFKPLSVSSDMNIRLAKIDEFKNKYHSMNANTGSTPRMETMVYSGERRLLGIATMHKSNLVPVFDSEDAKELARMRRG
jgi:hypothetical protein